MQPTPSSNRELDADTRVTQLRRNSAVVLLIFVLVVVAALAGFRHAGRWLVREDPLARADVIFVLSGGLPYRAEEAAKVFAMGYAPEVWVGRPERPGGELEQHGVHFIGEEQYNCEILVHDGVPETAIRILPEFVVDTEREVEEAAGEMRRTGKTKIIIVTSPEHTRRVKALWEKLVGDNPVALVHGAHNDPFDPSHWWRDTRDIFSVVRETLGLVNVWAGLPVGPKNNGERAKAQGDSTDVSACQ
jgi:uncharacterized SAM-binding protein YcdF (DUF218 family)